MSNKQKINNGSKTTSANAKPSLITKNVENKEDSASSEDDSDDSSEESSEDEELTAVEKMKLEKKKEAAERREVSLKFSISRSDMLMRSKLDQKMTCARLFVLFWDTLIQEKPRFFTIIK